MINREYIWEVDTPEKLESDFNKLDPIILQLLKKRGINTPKEISRFINPNLDLLYNPMLLKDMDKAVKRINYALSKREKITIFGDYDVDGITSTCILVKHLRKLGAHVDYYIPSRLHEGYGLNKEAIDRVYKGGTKLIITVDNGISAIQEVDYALKLGVDVIITDHHEPQEFVPKACAVVNPKQRDCPYPFRELAGVGVALKLIQALSNVEFDNLREYIELAAIGTVADMVPLIDENRIIVKNGLSFLENTKNVGIQTLKTLLNLNDTTFDTFKISFMVAPRLNATGRIADPSVAVEFLLCEDEVKARTLAEDIQKINQERQAIETKILGEAKDMVEQDVDLELDGVIVISNPDWHPGVLGTVASKLVDIYNRPCILILEEGDESRGSGRSIQGINLFDAVSRVSHRLIRYGGHEQALGMGMKTDEISLFRDELNELVCEKIKDIDLSPKLKVDMELKLEDINLNLAKQIELMEPFGFGNPKPKFMCRNLVIKNMRTVGEGDKHLKLSFKRFEKPLSAIGFNFGLYEEDLNFAPVVDAVFYLEINRWRGIVEPQLNIKDVKIPYIKDDLLHRMEENYYNKFFSRTVSIVTQEVTFNTDSLVNIPKVTKGDYLLSLLKTDRRVLVVSNTPYGARQLMAYLYGIDDIKENIEVIYDLESGIQRGKNYILINPFIEFDQADFDDILFYDTPFDLTIFTKQINSIPSSTKIHVLFRREDIRYNYLACCKILPSVNDIRNIYTLLRRVTSGTFLGTLKLKEFNNLLKNYLEYELHDVGLKNVFTIFKELDIIDFNINNDFINITDYKKHYKKLTLESSYTYKNLSEFKNKVRMLNEDFNFIKSLKNREEDKWTCDKKSE